MERSSRDNHQDNQNQDHQEDDERKPAARTFLWVKVPIDDQKETMTSIVVEEGDSIDTIRKAIKRETSPDFDSISTTRIELFESEQDMKQKKPSLDARMKWNSTVTWGTENTPLFVQVPVNRNSESPRSNNNGEC
jgi:hypothetical protein